jgi:hypothetical protein
MKRTSDPSQEQRVNDNLINGLRLHAKRISKLPVVNISKKTKEVFWGSGRLPIAPYDRYLRLFLKVIERYPFNMKVQTQGKDNELTAFNVSHPALPSASILLTTFQNISR